MTDPGLRFKSLIYIASGARKLNAGLSALETRLCAGLDVVNIDSDPEPERRYGERVPVHYGREFSVTFPTPQSLLRS